MKRTHIWLLVLATLFCHRAFAARFDVTLSCLTKPLIRSVLEQRNLAIAFDACGNELRLALEQIDKSLATDAIINATLATAVSHNTAPYGSSGAWYYNEIITDTYLNCGNQTLLVGYLLPDAKLRFIGVDGGAVGNHAQLILEQEKLQLLLDPTISAIAKTNFNHLFQGQPITDVIVINPNPENSKYIRDTFTSRVVNALQEGNYKPSDILYYFQSLNHRLGLGPTDRYITPGRVSWRSRLTKLGVTSTKPHEVANRLRLVNR